MKREVKVDASDVTLNIFIQDSSSSSGAGKTGLAFNTSGLKCYYVRPKAAAVAVPLATQTVTGSHTDGGFVEIDASNMPGWYRLDMPDTPWASGVTTVGIMLHGASGMAPVPMEVQLSQIAPTTNGQEIADAVWMRNMAMIESGSANGSLPYRKPLDSMRLLRNKWAISGGTLTVEKEDDSTDAWTAAITTTSGDPISTVDPA